MKTIRNIQIEEINFWRDSVDEKPGSTSIMKIVEKASNATILMECLSKCTMLKWDDNFRVLELGGG